MATNDLSYKFKTANIVVKLIVINVVVWLGLFLIEWALNMGPVITRWLSLPTDLGRLLIQPWSLLTYAFLHGGFWHIFWNMLILYWFGQIVLNLFTEKRFLTVYLLGALAGGVLYVLAYNLFPVLITSTAYLVGASAAVRAIMIFIATYSPNTEVRIIFFNVKLWHIGVFVVLTDLIQLPTSGNAGGLLAHLGGALFGYVYATQLAKGNDIGAWWERLADTVMGWFKSQPKQPKKAKMKTVYKNQSRSTTSYNASAMSKSEQQKRIDSILDKISKSGYESLSKEDKDFLFKAGKEN
ncbi:MULTISPECIES: rhomboid family intramembrane serine protease [unclassified Leeuwenhoekiella]|uniref:rhomboid family protein n=1 Tax=unclassified Leeuwenhoekiella TaxID=2615029 RepID=UPI000C5F8731|nr:MULTISPECIES: rhomboid family intramembrane serine protease [unclassified Leeuwenhoekiella]MAW94565.1 rhomboid family intramembrane serine protease [Leeuwenhoekiella sp.]MBA81988.1 rhomboid family intramembrane serine protease [Leeuwenhoekiella sp.]|tara:strand:+ start:31783 stop:32670 length:888 start_codon:yes stop_codon:yes gene_type:complete